jgi:hypothetical protein
MVTDAKWRSGQPVTNDRRSRVSRNGQSVSAVLHAGVGVSRNGSRQYPCSGRAQPSSVSDPASNVAIDVRASERRIGCSKIVSQPACYCCTTSVHSALVCGRGLRSAGELCSARVDSGHSPAAISGSPMRWSRRARLVRGVGLAPFHPHSGASPAAVVVMRSPSDGEV